MSPSLQPFTATVPARIARARVFRSAAIGATIARVTAWRRAENGEWKILFHQGTLVAG